MIVHHMVKKCFHTEFRTATAAVALLLSMFLVGACGEDPGGDSGEAVPAALPVVDLDGLDAIIERSAKADEILVIDFWASWCVPCIELFPRLHKAVAQLNRQHDQAGQGDNRVKLVSVTLDSPGKYEAAAIAFLARHDALDHAYLMKPDSDEQIRIVQSLGRDWNDLVVPAILVYGSDGRLIGEFIGGSTPEPIVELLDRQLGS